MVVEKYNRFITFKINISQCYDLAYLYKLNYLAEKFVLTDDIRTCLRTF